MVFLGEKLIHKSMWESSMRLGWISHVNFLIKFLSKDMDVSQMIFTWVSNDFFHPNSFQRTFKRTKECWKDFDQNMNVKHYIQFSSTWHVNSIWCWKNYIQDISAGTPIQRAPSRMKDCVEIKLAYIRETFSFLALQETATEIQHTSDAFTKKIELVSVPNLICKWSFTDEIRV